MSPLALLLLSLPATAATQAGLVICSTERDCAADTAWIAAMGGGGPGEISPLDLSRNATPDTPGAKDDFDQALAALRDAVDNARWTTAIARARDARAALDLWAGPVRTQELFDLYIMGGVAAAALGRDEAYAYDFRQAAAIMDRQRLPTPSMSGEVERIWLDEQRKLQVGGRGTLVLKGAPRGTVWTVDGRTVTEPELSMWPGNHRVSASIPGHIRTWTVDVPVLPGRVSKLAPDTDAYDQAAWVFGALDDAVRTLDAPEEVEDLLVAWADEHEVEEIRLLRVEEATVTPRVAPVVLSEPPADRPDAAAGETADMGDGVPTTYEGEITDRFGAPAEGHVQRLKRLRVVFFDPVTRRFSTEPRASTALQAPPARLFVGAATAWTGIMDRGHLGGDLTVQVPVLRLSWSTLDAEGRVGMVRATEPYNLYRQWSDRGLYHFGLGARWAPTWTVAPFAAAGAELFAPVAVGGRVAAGVQLSVDDWRLAAEGAFVGLDQGIGGSGGLSLTRGF